MDTHVQIASALERGLQLDKVATVATGPKQHDSLTSISGSSGGDEAVPNSSSKRSSRSQVSWSDASPVRNRIRSHVCSVRTKYVSFTIVRCVVM